ncbi:MAG: Zn-dependent hydrolase [Gemmatimonadales bacterium]
MHRRDAIHALGAALLAPRLPLRRRPAPPADWNAWRVDGARVNRWLSELSRFGRNADGGVSRVGFTDADIEGRGYTMERMRAAGLEVEIDPAGNILGRREGTAPGLRPIIIGSHVDSVLHGGNYDGDVGSLGAVEVALTLAERGYRNRHPLWVAVWCDEESGLTGSRGFIGQVSAEQLAAPYREGRTLAECIARIGGDPARMSSYRTDPGSVASYVELHIEQGGNLDRDGQDIAVVEGIVGIRSWNVTIDGFANHAGTTPMAERKNALLAAAELILAVDSIVKAEPGRQVGTVGRLSVEPGAQNVVPGRVLHSIELRDLEMAKLERLWSRIRAEGDRIMERHGTSWEHVEKAVNTGARSSAGVRSAIGEATDGLRLSRVALPSMAGHDAQSLASVAPMGMIFVPSVGGISHSPKEYTAPEDVTNGVNVLLQTTLRLDQAGLTD